MMIVLQGELINPEIISGSEITAELFLQTKNGNFKLKINWPNEIIKDLIKKVLKRETSSLTKRPNYFTRDVGDLFKALKKMKTSIVFE